MNSIINIYGYYCGLTLFFMQVATFSVMGQMSLGENNPQEKDKRAGFTFIEFEGKLPDDFQLSYALYGVCPENTLFYTNRKITHKLPIELICLPEGFNDIITINLIKPRGYNIINPNDRTYNHPETGNMILKISEKEPIKLMIMPVKELDLYYLELSGEIAKQKVVQKMHEVINATIEPWQEWYIFASNVRNPLTLSSVGIDKSSDKDSFLNRIQSLQPDPAFAFSDAERIKAKYLNREKDFQYKRINLHFFLHTTNQLSFNQLVNEIAGILPDGNQGCIYLYFDAAMVLWEINFDLREKLELNTIEYVIY